MKEIISRKEFGERVNFGKHQVITIDLNQEAYLGALYKGDKVRVDFGKFRTGERYLSGGEVLYNEKENKIEVASYGTCLSANFTYEDAIEDVEYAKAPIIDEGDEVVIIIHNSLTREFKAYLATAKNKNKFCSTMMVFE